MSSHSFRNPVQLPKWLQRLLWVVFVVIVLFVFFFVVPPTLRSGVSIYADQFPRTIGCVQWDGDAATTARSDMHIEFRNINWFGNPCARASVIWVYEYADFEVQTASINEQYNEIRAFVYIAEHSEVARSLEPGPLRLLLRTLGTLRLFEDQQKALGFWTELHWDEKTQISCVHIKTIPALSEKKAVPQEDLIYLPELKKAFNCD